MIIALSDRSEWHTIWSLPVFLQLFPVKSFFSSVYMLITWQLHDNTQKMEYFPSSTITGTTNPYYYLTFADLPPPPFGGEPPPILPGEQPPPYTPANGPQGGVPMINCRVCQSMINLEGRLHQHVVKCGVCHEATVSSLY